MSDLRARLRNMRSLRTPPRPPIRYDQFPDDQPQPDADAEQPAGPQSLEALAQGELHETPYGASYMLRTPHASDHTHGDATLDSWLAQSLAGAAVFSGDPRLAGINPRRCLFLDTETTGLSAGAGTLVFLVGLGLFTESGFEVRQYFLRDPGEELAMLHAIRSLMDQHEALVTFNGRTFDMPLLASRYTMNRQQLPTQQWPNLDLLYPARRLWKRRLESCRLSSLESAILGVRRTGQDVPGWLIPQLYHEYLQTGDARQMRRVMYHNLYDVLSMVTLAAVLCDTFTRADTQALPQQDLLSLARWYEGLGMSTEAEAAFGKALAAARDRARKYEEKQCLEGLAALLKRQERRAEAVPLWLALVELAPTDLAPRLELAKYHEWDTHNLDQALAWTDSAQAINNGRPSSYDQQTVADELSKRHERLLHKLAR